MDWNMLLTIRTTYRPATDLGFLLHKHPEHVHTRDSRSGMQRCSIPKRPRKPAPPRSCLMSIPSAADQVQIRRAFAERTAAAA
jgi:Hen1-like subunit of RNA repair complex